MRPALEKAHAGRLISLRSVGHKWGKLTGKSVPIEVREWLTGRGGVRLTNFVPVCGSTILKIRG